MSNINKSFDTEYNKSIAKRNIKLLRDTVTEARRQLSLASDELTKKNLQQTIDYANKQIEQAELPKTINKSKIYLQPDEKAPENKQVIRGPQGGQYYESGKGPNKRKFTGFKQMEFKPFGINPIGTSDLQEVTGYSLEQLKLKIIKSALSYYNHQITEGDIAENEESIVDTLDFLDFYIRLSHDSKNITDRELERTSKEVSNKTKKYMAGLESIKQHYPDVYNSISSKMEKNSIIPSLAYGERNNKIIAIDTLMSIAHDVEPTIIPHIFGVDLSYFRVPIQVMLTEVLDYLAKNEGKMEKSFQNIRKENRKTKMDPKEQQKELKHKILGNIEQFLEKATFEEESKTIEDNKKSDKALNPHDFVKAKWTHPNAHPRCLLCGMEEPIGGQCKGLKEHNTISKAKESVQVNSATSGDTIGAFLKGYEALALLGTDYSDSKIDKLFNLAKSISAIYNFKLSLDNSTRLEKVVGIDSVAHSLHMKKNLDGSSEYEILDNLASISKSYGELDRSSRLILLKSPESLEDVQKLLNIEIIQKSSLDHSDSFWTLLEKAIKIGVERLSNSDLIKLREWVYSRI